MQMLHASILRRSGFFVKTILRRSGHFMMIWVSYC